MRLVDIIGMCIALAITWGVLIVGGLIILFSVVLFFWEITPTYHKEIVIKRLEKRNEKNPSE